MKDMKTKRTVYTCPMHPEVVSTKPGKCPKCGGMDLVEVSQANDPHASSVVKKSKFTTFLPLIIIFSLLLAVSYVQVLVMRWHADQNTMFHSGMVMPTSSSSFDSSMHVFMASFMGGFFIIFGAFKLLDIKGFVHGFRTYDVIAQGLPQYGYVYPFLELGLGFAFLLHQQTTLVSLITLAISMVGLLSVWLKLRKKEKIQCVCLGTVFDLPLTNVTLFENLIMALMAVAMFMYGVR